MIAYCSSARSTNGPERYTIESDTSKSVLERSSVLERNFPLEQRNSAKASHSFVMEQHSFEKSLEEPPVVLTIRKIVLGFAFLHRMMEPTEKSESVRKKLARLSAHPIQATVPLSATLIGH